MPGKQDIQAGKAFIELGIKDTYTAGLKAASANLKSFGAGMATVGAAIAGAGVAITAPLLGALQHFADVGGALDDMSQRTGISAAALAELGHAADMSGTNIEGVEKGIIKMQKTLGEAAEGSAAARDAIHGLGLSMEDLQGMSPDEQFEKLATTIAAIEDPTEKATAAMSVFGKSGTSLIPLFNDIERLREEARNLGLAPDDKTVQAAAELGDAFDRVKASVGAVVFQIGSALASSATKAADLITSVVVSVNGWVRENKALITTVAAVGVGLIAAGAAIAGVGLAISAAGIAIGGLATAIGVLGTVVGAVLSPFGLIVAAVAGGVAAWMAWTESGQDAAAGIATVFGDLADTFSTTFGGIKDALSGGELMLAAQIAMAGLNVAWQTGLNAINEATGGAVDWLRDAFDSVYSSITFATENWRIIMQTAFQSAGLAVVTFANETIHFLTVAIPGYLKWFADNWRDVFTDVVNLTQTVATNIWSNLKSLWEGIKGLFNGEGFKFEWTPLTEGFESAIKELPKIAEREIGPLEQQMRDRLAELSDELATAADAHDKQWQADHPRRTQAQALGGAREELAALTKRAADAADAKAKEDDDRKKKAGEAGEFKASGKEVIATFSAAALAAQGGGGSPEVDELRKLRQDQAAQHRQDAEDRKNARIAARTELRQLLSAK